MKTYLRYILLIALLSNTVIGCSDYLDVKPEDKFLESQVVSSVDGLNSYLNGIYLALAKNDLYGGNLTMSFVEVLGQRYNLSDTNQKWYYYGKYTYTDKTVKATTDNIWSSAYTSILNVNTLLSFLDNQKVLSTSSTNMMKGEALGIRAMLHFDLLRLFGPIYSKNPSAKGIPYYTNGKAELSPMLPANEVIEMVLLDLAKAEELLANDVIIKNGIAGDASDVFFQNRNRRINYYAIKALQARVSLYAGNKQAALEAAELVIQKAESLFPWSVPTTVISGDNPDRTFSSELIFAVENPNLYTQQSAFFSSSLTSTSILAPNSFRLDETFDTNENDYRYSSSWAIPSVGSKAYKTFYKYSDVSDKTKSFRYLQPLLRIAEMYYIAAETTTDQAQALRYLNTVRFNRGLTNLSNTAIIDKEIAKEYAKEFFGEGQLFFYYKRKNATTIPDGSRTQATYTISMSDTQYVLPLPDSETKFNN